MALATSAAAQVTYTGPRNVTASVSSVVRLSNENTSHRSSKNIFLNGANGPGFEIAVDQHCCGGDGFLQGSASVKGQGGLQFLVVNPLNLRKLGSSVNISTAGNFSAGRLLLHTRGSNVPGFFHTRGLWSSGRISFAGFDFKTGTTAGSKTDYGWVRLKYNNSQNGLPESITAVDWEYGLQFPRLFPPHRNRRPEHSHCLRPEQRR